MKKLRLILLAAPSALLLSAPGYAETTWYVDSGAAPGGDGQSWTTAFDDLQAPLELSAPGDRIWVKEGTYRPSMRTDPNDPRSATFALPMGVGVYGGFDGTETSLEERAGLFDQTILSGDLGAPGELSDNARRVVWVNNPSGVPAYYHALDGFTIRDGNTEGAGAGVLSWNSALLLRHCIIRENHADRGAGLVAEPGIVRLSWCDFIDNHADLTGGASFVRTVSIKASHCRFRGNSAGLGGAIHVVSSDTGFPPSDWVSFFDSEFCDNVADEGGAILLGQGTYQSGGAVLYNCTVAFNRARSLGGAIRVLEGAAQPGRCALRNCIVWGNEAPFDPGLSGRQLVRYCDVQDGGYQGGGNLCADPLFVDPEGRDLRLLPGSPAADAGHNLLLGPDYSDADEDGVFAGEPIQIDLDGRRRVADDPLAPDVGGPGWPVVDLGAYES